MPNDAKLGLLAGVVGVVAAAVVLSSGQPAVPSDPPPTANHVAAPPAESEGKPASVAAVRADEPAAVSVAGKPTREPQGQTVSRRE